MPSVCDEVRSDSTRGNLVRRGDGILQIDDHHVRLANGPDCLGEALSHITRQELHTFDGVAPGVFLGGSDRLLDELHSEDARSGAAPRG